MDEITGTLENWVYDVDYNMYWGNLYNDIHKRWVDGTRIHTSSILSKGEAKEGDIIKTLNSTYKLGKPLVSES